jgi:murein DD-endopeptidase MepM/ murein hydrolase activator NlpD
MTRLGWSILAVIVLVVAAFLSMTSFGGGTRPAKFVEPPSATADVPKVARPDVLVVPVAGFPRAAIRDNWGDPRERGLRAHHGTDIIASAGTPVVAAAPGVIEQLHDSALGGTTLYLRSLDRRWIYYYAHLAGYAPDIVEGKRVRAGQVLGYVGDTGDAGPGNYHLHFGMQRMQPDERWYQGEDVNPYPMLAAGGAGR